MLRRQGRGRKARASSPDRRDASAHLAQRQRPAGAFEREVVATEREPCGDLPARVIALPRDRVHFGILHRPLRGEFVAAARRRRRATARWYSSCAACVRPANADVRASQCRTSTSHAESGDGVQLARERRRVVFQERQQIGVTLGRWRCLPPRLMASRTSARASIEAVERNQRSSQIPARRDERRFQPDRLTEGAVACSCCPNAADAIPRLLNANASRG